MLTALVLLFVSSFLSPLDGTGMDAGHRAQTFFAWTLPSSHQRRPGMVWVCCKCPGLCLQSSQVQQSAKIEAAGQHLRRLREFLKTQKIPQNLTPHHQPGDHRRREPTAVGISAINHQQLLEPQAAGFLEGPEHFWHLQTQKLDSQECPILVFPTPPSITLGQAP